MIIWCSHGVPPWLMGFNSLLLRGDPPGAPRRARWALRGHLTALVRGAAGCWADRDRGNDAVGALFFHRCDSVPVRHCPVEADPPRAGGSVAAVKRLNKW